MRGQKTFFQALIPVNHGFNGFPNQKTFFYLLTNRVKMLYICIVFFEFVKFFKFIKLIKLGGE
jgi:hypothetical protein